ncbi:MAG: hypothetical protein AAF389_04235 [Gemmatimonadota bacterium]
MRFAYIDSNGNEVPIPSVDALALRIELGAITDDTQLYDASADEWGPASSHEIYHSLSRASADDDGFIAPPPVAPIPVLDEDEEEIVLPSAEQPAEALLEESEPAAEAPMAIEVDASATEQPVESADGATEAPEVADDLGFDTLELAPVMEPLEEDDAAIDRSGPEDDDSLVDDGGDRAAGEPFDFGSMDGLESEATFEAPADDPGDAMDFSSGASMDFSGDETATAEEPALGFRPDFEDDVPTPDFSGGMELESPMEFSTSGFDVGGEGGLDLETPMSDFSPDAPPAWMDQPSEGPGPDQDVMDFATSGADAVEPALKADLEPKNRPSKPRRPRRSLAGPLVAVVLLVAGGVGAYSAWPAIQEWMESRNAPDEPLVVLPPLAEELVPALDRATDQAFADLLVAARQATGPQLQSPPTLEGAYMANASQYGAAEEFWSSMGETLDAFRAVDVTAFDAAVAAALGTSLQEGDATAIRERADSGFVAAAAEREAAFDQAAALFDAGVRFHQFLVANEANIEHAPASAVTTDPIAEVDPATEEIRAALNDLMDGVLGGYAAIGYRDVPTADGLWATVLSMVQEAGVQ